MLSALSPLLLGHRNHLRTSSLPALVSFIEYRGQRSFVALWELEKVWKHKSEPESPSASLHRELSVCSFFSCVIKVLMQHSSTTCPLFEMWKAVSSLAYFCFWINTTVLLKGWLVTELPCNGLKEKIQVQKKMLSCQVDFSELVSKLLSWRRIYGIPQNKNASWNLRYSEISIVVMHEPARTCGLQRKLLGFLSRGRSAVLHIRYLLSQQTPSTRRSSAGSLLPYDN